MQSLWNILLVLLCLILAAKFHTVDIDKTKLEYDKTSLHADKKQLHKRVQIAESKAEKCVQANDACQQQLEKFETLKKTSKLNDDKLDYQADQLRRLQLKNNHFRSLLNKTQQVKDEVQPVECAVKTNHHQQVQDEVQPKNLDYAQTFIYVVEGNIFCLVCVLMYVLWNLYKTKTTNSTKSKDFTEEDILLFGEYLHSLHVQPEHDHTNDSQPTSNQLALQILWQHLLTTPMGKRAMKIREYALTPQEVEDRWAAFTASNWNQLQSKKKQSQMTSTANFYHSSHDNAENKFNRNPSNKHGRCLDEYRAHLNNIV